MRLDDQDRTKWDQALIARGLGALVEAASGNELSEYHLQAGIAAIHCTATDYASTDWTRILRHYDALGQDQAVTGGGTQPGGGGGAGARAPGRTRRD